ncbi:MAG: hypothetical protein J0M15_04120 [Deltaproteobacteria bacterium]|nr:hypothetical protein [Deltaproteobacteria bacterium]
MKFKIGFMIFIIAIHARMPEDVSTKAFVRFKLNQMHEQLVRGELPITPFLNAITAGSPAFAEGDTSCEKQEAVRIKCLAAWTDYAHGALKYFNGTLCRFNNETAADVETTLCHFRKSMGIKVDLASLPVSATKTFGGKTIVVEIVAPTESWAVAAGYQAKGTVTVGGTQYMLLYWGGKDTQTKGFMVEGYDANGIGGNRAGYLTWDLTNDNAQFVKMYRANFPSGSYLGSAAKTSTSYRGDASIYGQLNFNKSTSAVSTQVIMIEEQRAGGTAGQFGCFRMYSSGTKGAQVTVAKTQNSLGGTGHSVSSTSLQLDSMDGVTLTDAVGTANGTGTSLSSQSALETALGVSGSVFKVSCADINNAGGASSTYLFSSSRTQKVDFAKTVTDVFP